MLRIPEEATLYFRIVIVYYDCYRRFISMYSDVVMGYDKSKFENIIDDLKKKKKIKK